MVAMEAMKAMESAGYVLRPEDRFLVRSMLSARWHGAKAVLIEGPPGAGKSFFAECLAQALRAPLVVHLCHEWTDADELFVGVDVAAVVEGNASAVRQDGVLARVARRAGEGPVVLLLDEIDKIPERSEFLLLDWLQSGRCPVAPGVQLQTNMDQVLVILTSNGQRQLSDATLRRVRRHHMAPLPVAQQEEILQQTSDLPGGIVKIAWKIARGIAQGEGNTALSLQEGANLLRELALCESLDELTYAMQAWASRTPQRHPEKNRQLPQLWGEIIKYRRGLQ